MNSRRHNLFATTLVLTGFVVLAAPVQAADPTGFSYGGRITDATGKPLAGTVDLQVKFYDDPTAGNVVGPTKTINDVPLSQGTFQISIDLTAGERDVVFGSGSPVYMELKDLGSGKVYPRQSFGAVPYALRVPVDGVTLQYNANGELEVQDMGGVPQSDVTFDGAGANDVSIIASPTTVAPYTLTLPTTPGPSGWVLSTNGAGGVLSWVNPAAGGGGDMLGANNLSDLVDASVARTNLGLVIGTNVQANSAQLTDLAGLSSADNNFIVGNGANFVVESGATARTSLGAQAAEATLSGLAATAPIANQMLYANGADTFTTVTTSAFGRGLLNETNGASLLATAGGQASEATLTGLAATAPIANQMLYANGADTFTTVTTSAFGRGLLNETNGASLLATAGGMASEATLTGLAATAPTANQVLYATGADTFSTVASTAFGRGLLNETNGASLLATAGGMASEATLTGLAATAPTANQVLYATGADTFSTTASTAFGRGLLNETNGASLLATAGAQASEATLTGIAATAPTANQMLYATGADTFSTITSTVAGRAMITAADAAAQKTLLGLDNASNTNVLNNFTQNDAQYVATDEIRARDAGGLKLYDDSGTPGIMVEDGGQIGVNIAAPAARLHVEETGGASTYEEIARFSVSDNAVASLAVVNASNADNAFTPAILSKGHGVNNALVITPQIVTDTGAAAALLVDASITNSAAVVTRPLFQVKNWGTPALTLGADATLSTGQIAASKASNGTADVYTVNNTMNRTTSAGSGGIFTSSYAYLNNAGSTAAASNQVIRGNLNHSGTGISSTPDAVLSTATTIAQNHTGTVNEIWVQGPAVSATKTLTNWNGIKIDGPSGAGAVTTKYALTTASGAGNVGIGTTTPTAKLQVNGAIVGGYFADTDNGIDWSVGNIQSTSVAPGATLNFTSGSMIDGGSYTLALTNTTGGNYTLGVAGDITTWKCIPACAGGVVTTDATKHTVLTILKMGTTGYVSWIKGF